MADLSKTMNLFKHAFDRFHNYGLKALCLASLLAFAASSCFAKEKMNEDTKAYVESNLLGILYHELGHAIIHLKEVPIFGQEEDAADVFSVLLIDQLHEEQDAQDIAYDAAFGYIEDPEGNGEVHYWDVHGPDEQRYYNHICLFVGANPKERNQLAIDLELPEERLEYCPEEFDQAYASWGAVLDELEVGAPANTIVLQKTGGVPSEHFKLLLEIVEQEIALLNQDFALPKPLKVNVSKCDEANAFYDPQEVSVTMCVEFVQHLIDRMPE